MPTARLRSLLVASVAALALPLSATAALAGGGDAQTSVSGDCTSVTATSTKDLSNVVLRFADGDVQKFEGLSGRSGTFAGTGGNAGEVITTVWVKSGNNASGDGPGYGERHERDTSGCDEGSSTETREETDSDGDGDGEEQAEDKQAEDEQVEDEPEDREERGRDGAGNSAATSGGGSAARTSATGSCTSVAVTSTKDLSNVVLRFADGDVQKFEGLSGRSGTFAGTGSNAGEVITTVWVKSGNNASGDGPGYGERHDLGTSDCQADDTDTTPTDDGCDPSDGPDGCDGDQTGTGDDCEGAASTSADCDSSDDEGDRSDDGDDDTCDAATSADCDDPGGDDDARDRDGTDGDQGSSSNGDGDSSDADDDEVLSDDLDGEDEVLRGDDVSDADPDVLGITETRERTDGSSHVVAAADAGIGALPNSGAAVTTLVMTALAALGLGAGLLRRSRTA